MIPTQELKARLVRISNQINILNLGINGLHRSMDELIVQFNDLVARCEECEKLDQTKKSPDGKKQESKSQDIKVE